MKAVHHSQKEKKKKKHMQGKKVKGEELRLAMVMALKSMGKM